MTKKNTITSRILRNKPTAKDLKAIVAAIAALVAVSSANAQGVSSCLADAASEYKRAWASYCPGGFNYPCKLRPLAASEAKSDWATARSICFENHNAESIDRADEAASTRVLGLKTERREPTPTAPSTDNEPRRKFWVSPQ